ncbi:MAG TPA: hypothetical protein VKY19_13030 [Ktedonosporobacter sp.]|jgi:ABC-type multidrug transport system fused ATPase/permease subunit|nr:hypothetical protein [Ktedonosporobacter sp.]
MSSKKEERLYLLEKQIEQLRGRIDRLDRRSNRYSWVRVTIFFVGLGLSVAGYFVAGWWLCLVLALTTLITFALVAYFHQYIEDSLARHQTWMRIKLTHVARMKLDWDAIPPAPPTEPVAGHPFEVDLDLSGPRSIHQLLNTAVSQEGSRRLREWLLATVPDPVSISRRQALVRELTPMTLFRDKLTMKSRLASGRVAEQLEGKRLLDWLKQQEPPSALLPPLLGAAALQILTIVFFLLNLFIVMPQLWIFTILAALTLFFSTAQKRGDIFADANYLRYGFATLSGVFSYLETYRYGKHEQVKKLCEPFYAEARHRPSSLLKQTARIASAATLKNNGLLWLIINALIPWDHYSAYRLSCYKAQIAARLPVWLDIWFELEALSSLATFAYLNPAYILPDIIQDRDTASASFSGSALGHPLIQDEKRITNDFTLNGLGQVVIITGSNMSGKSTFLRTLGVNLCLAFAGGPTCASKLQTTPFRIFSCIRVSDSVTDGYSYFYAEVRRLKELLLALERPDSFPLFFLIDEIFKGTNNRERLIGSQDYVEALVGRNCVGAISTHDLELVKLADTLQSRRPTPLPHLASLRPSAMNTMPEVSNYHFKEEIIDGQMVFDYKLRLGPCPTTNALKIMRMEGLPVREQ